MSRIIILSLLFLSCRINAATLDSLELKSEVEKVTVFFRGAQLFAFSNLNLRPGEHYLRIKGLPASIDPQSIKVDGHPDFLIHSVNHMALNNQGSSNPRIKALKQKQIELNFSYNQLLREYKVYQTEKKILLENSKLSNGSQSMTAAQISAAADMFRQRLFNINKEQERIEVALGKIEKEDLKVSEELNSEVFIKQKKSVDLIVKLECEKPFRGKLKFSYFCSLAGWTPTYDIRVQDLKSPLELIYKAAIYQTTGLNWQNVHLTLSTENPEQSQVAPELKTWTLPTSEQSSRYQKPRPASRLDGIVQNEDNERVPFARVRIYSNNQLIYQGNTDTLGQFSIKPLAHGQYIVYVDHLAYKSQSRSFSTTASTPDIQIILKEKRESALIQKAKSSNITVAKDIQNMAVRDLTSIAVMGNKTRKVNVPIMASSVSSDISNLRYEISKKQDIPSDGKDYIINMVSSSVSADFNYVVVPKIDPRAYLNAQIVNWEELHLLSGPARLYLSGSYVGSTFIDPSTTSDTLQLSLGIDKGISIQRKLGKQVKGGGLFGGDILKEMNWEIEVRNLKSEAIKVLIFDQIPVSDKKYITVKTLDLGNAKLEPKTGEMQWILDLPANSSKNVQFSYQVIYPEKVSVYID